MAWVVWVLSQTACMATHGVGPVFLLVYQRLIAFVVRPQLVSVYPRNAAYMSHSTISPSITVGVLARCRAFSSRSA